MIGPKNENGSLPSHYQFCGEGVRQSRSDAFPREPFGLARDGGSSKIFPNGSSEGILWTTEDTDISHLPNLPGYFCHNRSRQTQGSVCVSTCILLINPSSKSILDFSKTTWARLPCPGVSIPTSVLDNYVTIEYLRNNHYKAFS
jgi:hypothetical protein